MTLEVDFRKTRNTWKMQWCVKVTFRATGASLAEQKWGQYEMQNTKHMIQIFLNLTDLVVLDGDHRGSD